jgi:hypothetical protein
MERTVKTASGRKSDADGGRGAGSGDKKGVPTKSERKRKERHSDNVARGVNTDWRRMVSGPTGFLTGP